MTSLPEFTYDTPAETWAPTDVAAGCLKGVEQPGTKFFRAFIRSNVGGGDSGISSCDRSYPSDHFEGRAWDWRLNAFDATDAARAQSVLDWLFANDWEIFRRLGLKYVIWNDRIYASGKSHKYIGSCDHCINPHTDHMHLSFAWPGARGQTSWFRAAGFGGGAPTVKPPSTSGGVQPTAPSPSAGGRVVAFITAGLLSYGLIRIFA